MGKWTGSRKKKPKKIPETLIVSDPAFFCKRSKSGRVKVPFKWSQIVLDSVLVQFERIVIFERADTTHSMAGFLESQELEVQKQVHLIIFGFNSVEDITADWVRELRTLGASFRRPKNPREITYLTLGNYLHKGTFQWTDSEGHRKFKIKLEKDKDFQELQKERRLKAEW